MSSKEHRKYIREQRVKDDKLQSKFSNEGNLDKITNITEITIKQEDKVNIDTVVMCPFCLNKDFLSKFLMTDSKGEISTYKVKCRECNQKMLMKTIKSMINMNNPKRIEAYAKWCVEYRQGFWKKVSKKIWDKRLKRYGMVGVFWKTYKNLKASIPRDYNEEDDYSSTKEEYLKEKEERFKRGEEQ